MFIKKYEQYPGFLFWKTYSSLSNFNSWLKLKESKIFLHWTVNTLMIIWKTCARYSKWLSNGEKITINIFHYKSSLEICFCPCCFSEWKIMFQWRYFILDSFPFIEVWVWGTEKLKWTHPTNKLYQNTYEKCWKDLELILILYLSFLFRHPF